MNNWNHGKRQLGKCYIFSLTDSVTNLKIVFWHQTVEKAKKRNKESVGPIWFGIFLDFVLRKRFTNFRKNLSPAKSNCSIFHLVTVTPQWAKIFPRCEGKELNKKCKCTINVWYLHGCISTRLKTQHEKLKPKKKLRDQSDKGEQKPRTKRGQVRSRRREFGEIFLHNAPVTASKAGKRKRQTGAKAHDRAESGVGKTKTPLSGREITSFRRSSDFAARARSSRPARFGTLIGKFYFPTACGAWAGKIGERPARKVTNFRSTRSFISTRGRCARGLCSAIYLRWALRELFAAFLLPRSFSFFILLDKLLGKSILYGLMRYFTVGFSSGFLPG